jgi:hypothetical protein
MERLGVVGRHAMAAITAGTLAIMQTAGGARAADADGPMCLLGLDEMSALVGTAFATRNAVDRECVYLADPAERFLAVVIERIPPDPTAIEPDPDGLLVLRWTYDQGGRDLTIAGLPAWVSEDGAWVDVGDDVLAVRPMFVFDDSAPPVGATAEAIAQEAVPRYLETSPDVSPAP